MKSHMMSVYYDLTSEQVKSAREHITEATLVLRDHEEDDEVREALLHLVGATSALRIWESKREGA